MPIQHDATFLFQMGIGIAHMVLGTLLFLNSLTFYYLGLGIYPAVVAGFSLLLIGIWLLGNRGNNRSVVYLKFASADQIAYFMQPLITIFVLNAIMASMAFYIYTLTPTAPYNSGFSIVVFVIGAIMFAHAKVPPRIPKVKSDEVFETTPLIQEQIPSQSYSDVMYNVGVHHMSYPNTQKNAKDMNDRNILEGTFSL